MYPWCCDDATEYTEESCALRRERTESFDNMITVGTSISLLIAYIQLAIIVYGLYNRERTWQLVALDNQTIDPQAAAASGIEVISESAASQREPADHEESDSYASTSRRRIQASDLFILYQVHFK